MKFTFMQGAIECGSCELNGTRWIFAEGTLFNVDTIKMTAECAIKAEATLLSVVTTWDGRLVTRGECVIHENAEKGDTIIVSENKLSIDIFPRGG